jgi:hypothetical protein
LIVVWRFARHFSAVFDLEIVERGGDPHGGRSISVNSLAQLLLFCEYRLSAKQCRRSGIRSRSLTRGVRVLKGKDQRIVFIPDYTTFIASLRLLAIHRYRSLIGRNRSRHRVPYGPAFRGECVSRSAITFAILIAREK